MSEDLALIAIALLGCMVGCVVALLPGVHVYSIAAIAFALASRGLLFTEAQLAMVLLGALVGWSVVNVIPAVFLFAPDDANALVVLPGTKLLMRGRGNDAVLLTAAGSVGALCVLMLLSPIFDELLRPLRTIIQPHAGWMLVAVITFLVLGEWPRANDRATTPLARLASAWVYLGAGLLTFVLSGLLGLALMYRSPIAIEQAYQNLMPAFVGLFTIPGIIQLAFLGQQPPKQTFSNDINLPPGLLLRGTLTGVVGGLFAGVLPVVSGGIGGLLAGHATAQRDDRLFLISMGASKVAYYLGSVLLLFVPGVTLTSGGLAAMLTSIYVPYGWHTYWLAVAAVAACGVFAFGALVLMARVVAKLVPQINIKWLAGSTFVLAVTLVSLFTGLPGIMVMLVAAAIGCIPLAFGGRRLNCLGVVLVPVTLNVIGIGPVVAKWLGLL